MTDSWLEEIGREAIERFGGEPLKARAREEMRRVSEDLGQRVVVLETEVGGMKGAFGAMERKLSEMEVAMERKLSDMEKESEKRGERQTARIDQVLSLVTAVRDEQMTETGRRQKEAEMTAKMNRREDRQDTWLRAAMPYISALLALAAIGWLATHPATRVVDVSVQPAARP